MWEADDKRVRVSDVCDPSAERGATATDACSSIDTITLIHASTLE